MLMLSYRPNSLPGSPPYHSSGRYISHWKPCWLTTVFWAPLKIGKIWFGVLPWDVGTIAVVWGPDEDPGEPEEQAATSAAPRASTPATRRLAIRERWPARERRGSPGPACPGTTRRAGRRPGGPPVSGSAGGTGTRAV